MTLNAATIAAAFSARTGRKIPPSQDDLDDETSTASRRSRIVDLMSDGMPRRSIDIAAVIGFRADKASHILVAWSKMPCVDICPTHRVERVKYGTYRMVRIARHQTPKATP